jgi:formylglycine-generating enzyme required for sulfatase activity
MGSPPTEPNRIAEAESPSRMVITRRFAIADCEVTVDQYQRFVRSHPEFGLYRPYLDRYSPEGAGPMIGVSWYGAAAYCNWLSEQEGLSPDQWCYLPNPSGMYDAGMTIPADVLKRSGYRLPTDAEWEYACRSGATTSRYYGQTIGLLSNHGWYQANSREHAWPGGTLIPSDLGLFDMLGNVYEWVQDRYRLRHGVDDNINRSELLKDQHPRILRGGSFLYLPANLRSALRVGYLPSDRDNNFGFRPSKTYR